MDTLGSIKGINYTDLIKDTKENTQTLDLFDDNDKSCGTITIKTKFVNPIEVKEEVAEDVKVTASVGNSTVKS